ncbi:NADH-ubiquinone oxidoreductase-F iron-sulfur binding region domain-containing protein [Williamsia sp. CHRR-6]|uniref:NADH-ubiquinone oxidoreductase-F iron-sulfur binding region domain-containing protein n=1 Tax=Williamsia sp. CHRR-6 TaxID=2835871 RepID=UPI001BDB4B51|nr:NADH-ubiquinone oxidoreductase-F iron-sulfur binding region domain-containing protein [Williamsia sp. CHRR-6]MBT0567331.1 NADH-quinone oxidoreductase subunit F [Williamsia sp. CHRR-6]
MTISPTRPFAVDSAATAAPSTHPRLLTGAGDDLDSHQRIYGPRRAADPGELLDAIDASGLSGRGGAAFPAARKLAATMKSGASARIRPVVVANGAEGEPLSRKDAVLLAQSPHLVLDGLAAVASAVGANTGYLCVPTASVDRMRALIAHRQSTGWDGLPVQVVGTAGRFVDGETSAIVDLIEGGPGRPRDRRVPTARSGVQGAATLVHNVETLAHIAVINRNGAQWFRGRGTAQEPGTMLATVSGVDGVDGVLEVDLGVPLAVLLHGAAGVDASRVRAVLVGGFHGTWVDGRHVAQARLSRESLSYLGAAPGAGVVRYLLRGECGLHATTQIVDNLADQSARQCGPCMFGLPSLARSTAELLAHGGLDRAAHVRRLADTVDGRGACAHPDGTAAMVRSALAVFADDIDAHGRGYCRRNR